MPDTDRRFGPLEYIVKGATSFTAMAAVLVTFTSPAVFGLGSLAPTYGGYAFVSATIFALIIAQTTLGDDNESSISYESLPMKIVIFTLAVIVYNTIVLAGGGLAVVAGEWFGTYTAAVVAALYPVWDIETMERNLPLSVGGIIAWSFHTLRRLGALNSRTGDFLSQVEYVPANILKFHNKSNNKRRRLN